MQRLGQCIPALAHFFAGDDHKGILDTGQIEGLGGGGHGHQTIGVGCHSGGSDLLSVAHDDVLMDLIGQHEHIILVTDSQQAHQFFSGPYTAHRIVRRAQNEQLHLTGCCQLLKALQVHGIAAIHLFQGTIDQLATVIVHRIHKRIVHRGHDADAVAGLRHHLHQPVDGRHHARGKADPLLVHLIAMVLLLPGNEGLVVAVRHLVITVNPGFHIVTQALLHAGRHLKIHIGHPQGQQVILTKHILQHIPLNAVGIFSFTIDDVFHV